MVTSTVLTGRNVSFQCPKSKHVMVMSNTVIYVCCVRGVCPARPCGSRRGQGTVLRGVHAGAGEEGRLGLPEDRLESGVLAIVLPDPRPQCI
eukprot:11286360-Heterocapsa_arctica.AAC.1